MTAESLLEALGYEHAGKFIHPESHELPANELSFALRHADQACKELTANGQNCGFHGAYVLQDEPKSPALPVVYFFEAETETAAKRIHRMVWNQNLVPFVIVIVASPSTIRIYPGFAYSGTEDKALKSVPASVAAVLEQLDAFTATAIDDGTLWKEWGDAANPLQRVDESLLRDLKELDQQLQESGLGRDASHGLIGKFVYLHYLRDRGILSDRKLAKWQIEPAAVFSHEATLKAFRSVNTELQEWLNGSVFQLGDEALYSVTQDQLQLVAGVFCGDSPLGQMSLFPAYDFSHIPIETLSCIYEQFLHDTKDASGQTRGKTLGAYYTPIPLADYLISELEHKRSLREGMKVLDPACGSGVFLVQCYRRLIEKRMREEQRLGLKKEELRTLLTEHIFGIDRDDDACRVTELSLILTLLDYVSPPDLENTTFKLPDLRKEGNISRDDFFDTSGDWHSRFGEERFDWVVGNPPWAEVKGEPPPKHVHYHAWKWITDPKSTHPTGGKQIAEAFLWKAGDHLGETGVAGLLVPAMTWFKKESVAFRKEFFAQREVWCLANFANLAYVLFAGRSESPASAVFFKRTPPGDDNVILTFAPFVAEQVANRPQKPRKEVPTWNIVVNGAEMREVPNPWAAEGAGLAWKLAMWGSTRDARLLQRLGDRCDSFEKLAADNDLSACEGLQLRKDLSIRQEPLEHHPDLIGKLRLDPKSLRATGLMFAFPDSALKTITAKGCYVRKGRGDLPKRVSVPPHIIVDASRRFAVFSNDFIAVPPRQVGIAGSPSKERLLRFLSLFFSSDFCRYHQFFVSPLWGVYFGLADLSALKELPVPIAQLSAKDLADWSNLQRELAALSVKQFTDTLSLQSNSDDRLAALISELNARVFKLLALRTHERWLIDDFVHLNLQLNKGKVSRETMRVPTPDELRLYLTTLRDCLDSFLSSSQGFRHRIEAVTGGESALFSVSLKRTSAPVPPSVFAADQSEARTLLKIRDRLRRKHSQWVYFDRSLKIYDRGVLYQFKPMQRIHWSRRQAILDADEIIAKTLTETGAP